MPVVRTELYAGQRLLETRIVMQDCVNRRSDVQSLCLRGPRVWAGSGPAARRGRRMGCTESERRRKQCAMSYCRLVLS